jgi:LPXTG-motif cell wall-anchored protein
MKINTSLAIICLLLLSGILPGGAMAYATPESIVAAGKVYISNAEYDPGAFFSGDTGTVTIFVTNGNSNQSIVVNHATIGDKNIRLTSNPYDTSANIGPLQTQTFIFSVKTDALEGTYYPTFSLSFRDADSLYYRAMAKVDNTPLELTIVNKPDAFTQGAKKTIYMQVANPRINNVRNVALEVTGDGISAAPEKTFIGDLAAGVKIPVNFTITPEKATTAFLTLTYDNGDNPHKVAMELPVAFGVDKKQAYPVISNVQVKTETGIYHVTGDVNNAGLETANTVTVTSLAPAVPQDPYKIYVVGALKPDDFGSFEVTFTADPGTTSVPVQLSFKDTDGNIFNTVQDVKISSSGLPATTETGSSSNMLPVAAAIVIVLIFVGGWVYYLRRNKK